MRIKNTLVTIAFALLFGPTFTNATLINEFQPNPIGADPSTMIIELLGNPGDSIDAWLLSIEGDSSASVGTIDRATQFQGIFDSLGLLSVVIGDLENPTFTLMLANAFTGQIGDDIDTDNNGIADNLGMFSGIMDAVGIVDSIPDSAFVFGNQLGGQDLAYSGDEPQLVFRDGISLEWFLINDPSGSQAFDSQANSVAFGEFNMDPSIDTFGSVNPYLSAQVPEPSTLAIFALAIMGFGLRRKAKA